MRDVVRAIRNWLTRTKIGPRLLATLLFAGYAYLGVNGISDAASILVNPTPSQQLLHIDADTARFRAGVLLALNVLILTGSLAAMLGAWQRGGLIYGYAVVAVVYAGLGLYQIVSALFQFNQPQLAFPGVVYLALAAAAFSLGRQLTRVQGRAVQAGGPKAPAVRRP